MVGEYVKIKIDDEVKTCEVLCFLGWNSELSDDKTTIRVKPHFLGFYNREYPYWVSTLFLYGILTVELNDDDKPTLNYNSTLKQHTVEERDVILRYKTATGNVIYQYMSAEEYAAADKEEYKEVKF